MAARQEPFPFETGVTDLIQTFRAAQRELIAQIEAAVRSGNLERRDQKRLQLGRLVALLDQIGAQTEPIARRLVTEAHAQGAARTAVQLGASVAGPEIPGAFAGISREAVAALQDSMIGRLRDSRATVGRQAQDIYAKAGRHATLRTLLGAEGSPRAAAGQLARDLQRDKDVARLVRDSRGAVGFVDKAGKRWGLDTYSEMVVRTTTREAVVQGQVDRMASHGVHLARVSIHNASCEICLPLEGKLVSLDGSVSEYHGEPVADASSLPPFHPQCLAPGTEVVAPDHFAGYRAWYDGDLVDLATLGGVRLSVTPNHPVMTTAGWLPAGELRKGDYVIRAAPDRSALEWRHDHHFHDMPTLVEDAFDALSARGTHATVAASRDDFHGDARCFEGEVDVVLADRRLLSELARTLGEEVGEHPLVRASVDEAGLVGGGSTPQVFGGLSLAAHGSMGSVGGLGSDADSVPTQPLSHRGGGYVGVNRQVVESLAREVAAGVLLDVVDRDDAAGGHAELFGSCPHGHAELLELGANAYRARAELAGAVREGCAVGVHADELVSVDRRAYSGHVYDLSTPVGSYEANTVIVSNCRHTIYPVVAVVDATRERVATNA